MTTSPQSSADLAALLRAAQRHHVDGRLAEAEAFYRRILDQDPGHVQALGLTAMILVDGPSDAEAEAMVLRHLALRPNDGASLYGLGRLRSRQGDDVAAAELFQRAAQWLPGLAPVHNELGVSLHRLDRSADALAALDSAIELDPAYGVAHANRSAVLVDLQRFDEAVDAQVSALALTTSEPAEARAAMLSHLTRAARKAGRLAKAEIVARAEIEAGRTDADIVEQLAQILELSKRPQEALSLRNQLARRTGVQRAGPGVGAEATVLLLGGVGGGHVPVRYLVDTSRFNTLSIGLLSPDQPDAPLGSIDIEALKHVDVVFSTLADVDHDPGQFAAAAALCTRLGKPVLNPSASIAKTGRDHAGALFEGIARLVTPTVRRTTPTELADLTIDAPVLARPAGDHGGENLTLLRNGDDALAFLATGPGERLLLTAFHDFQSPDGFWRKYRLIFIDRQVYPYHLVIGDDWLLHYWRAEMARSPWKRAEEEAFLADWRGLFGATAASAVEEVARRLDLDYGGVDCALMPDGQVLLFEANGCILLHLDEPVGLFGYKHRHVPPVRQAFSRLIRERAGL